MLQSMELSAATANEGSRETQAMERVTPWGDTQRRPAATAGKYRIINATTSGAAYNPTPAQISAAQMAEEFYGTKVTFVHADLSTFKGQVQKLTGHDSDHISTASPANTRTKHRTTSSAGLQKSTTFKHPGKRPTSRTLDLQRLQLRVASPSLQMQSCAASSAMPSPVSPLTVFNEFENYSSGDGAQGSADTQAHDYVDLRDRSSDEDDSQVDGSFTFPYLFKETTTLSQPKLLHLFPEAPDDG